MPAEDHNRLIAKYAKTELGSIGCVRKGRSRIWIDDHAWWVLVVEFQPSSWSKGSYLNVGACWLWNLKDYLSFDYGNRVERFQSAAGEAPFEKKAQMLAAKAKATVEEYRVRFSSIRAVSTCLNDFQGDGFYSHFHAGVAAGLIGDTDTCNHHLCLVTESNEDREWALDVKRRAKDLLGLANDLMRFRKYVCSVVIETRHKMGLPAVSEPLEFDV